MSRIIKAVVMCNHLAYAATMCRENVFSFMPCMISIHWYICKFYDGAPALANSSAKS